MRGERYCEVLLVQPKGAGASATVYSTYTLSQCPAALWKRLDAKTIAAANKVPIALLNGPRYWTMDAVTKTPVAVRHQQRFGGLLMNRLATVDIPFRAAAVLPYVPSSVNRSTVFTYRAGSRVYELTTDGGEKYVMQSWSQQVDPALSEADLAGLGRRLTLPAGWKYSSRVLTAPLEVVTVDVPADVLQDDLKNSYSRESES
jgi:hypothetical protein